MIINTLVAFSSQEYTLAKQLLAAKVSTMMGRKMEEGDWSFVYTNAKRIPQTTWSNLNIDIIHNGTGIEHKMMKYTKMSSIKELCGTTLMHPAATRSIRINTTDIDPNIAAKDVLEQYAQLIEYRKEVVKKNSKSKDADLRFGWLLWKDRLDEFLYFEVPMYAPNPDDYYAEWNEIKSKGSRKPTKNLWIYDKITGQKRYSVTTVAGAKVQPYFDVPPPTDPNLYYFRVQGNEVQDNIIEVWIANTTARYLESLIGTLSISNLSKAILESKFSKNMFQREDLFVNPTDIAIPVSISKEAYQKLESTFGLTSDEYMIQQFALNYVKSV
jgi:hypothetical protein